jgi:hypothetical protein
MRGTLSAFATGGHSARTASRSTTVATRRNLPSIAFLSLFGSLVWAVPATAQGCAAAACRATNAAHATVKAIMRLTVNGSTTVVVSPSPKAYAAGHDQVAGPTATVKSNSQWKLQISAAQPTWNPADAGARADKPAPDLQWSTTPAGEYRGVTVTPADVVTGSATAGTTLPLHYRAEFDRAGDTPGTYTLVVKLTLVGA